MRSLLRDKNIEQLNILLVGNNPIELSNVLSKLVQLRGHKVVVETAFDLKSSLERMMKFTPNYIVIDDNMGKSEFGDTVNHFATNCKTKDIPITVLKNSNYQESLASTSILDYILKQNFSADRFYNTIRNVLKFKRTQRYLTEAYRHRKGLLMKLKTGRLNLVS